MSNIATTNADKMDPRRLMQILNLQLLNFEHHAVPISKLRPHARRFNELQKEILQLEASKFKAKRKEQLARLRDECVKQWDAMTAICDHHRFKVSEIHGHFYEVLDLLTDHREVVELLDPESRGEIEHFFWRKKRTVTFIDVVNQDGVIRFDEDEVTLDTEASDLNDYLSQTMGRQQDPAQINESSLINPSNNIQQVKPGDKINFHHIEIYMNKIKMNIYTEDIEMHEHDDHDQLDCTPEYLEVWLDDLKEYDQQLGRVYCDDLLKTHTFESLKSGYHAYIHMYGVHKNALLRQASQYIPSEYRIQCERVVFICDIPNDLPDLVNKRSNDNQYPFKEMSDLICQLFPWAGDNHNDDYEHSDSSDNHSDNHSDNCSDQMSDRICHPFPWAGDNHADEYSDNSDMEDDDNSDNDSDSEYYTADEWDREGDDNYVAEQ